MNPGFSIFGVYPGRAPDLAIGFAPETVPLDCIHCTRVESPCQNSIKHSHCWLLSLPSPAEIELRSSLALIPVAREHGSKFQVMQQKRSKGSYLGYIRNSRGCGRCEAVKCTSIRSVLRFSPPMIMIMTDTALKRAGQVTRACLQIRAIRGLPL
jgi:hypothetical protein